MSRIAALTPPTAQGAAQDMLTELVARHGQVGAMVSTVAHSPAVLGGYLPLSKATTFWASPVRKETAMTTDRHAATSSETMQAVVQDTYGSADVQTATGGTR